MLQAAVLLALLMMLHALTSAMPTEPRRDSEASARRGVDPTDVRTNARP
jgi:hypothetical protein